MDASASPISKPLSARISILRALLIVLIVYLHAYNLQGFNFEYGIYETGLPPWMQLVELGLSRAVAYCAVPGFFLLSGLLLYAKPVRFWPNTKKKLKTVLLPFLFWNSVWIAFFLIAQSIPSAQSYFSAPERYVRGFALGDWLRAYFPLKSSEVFCSPLWFLSDLFRLNLLAVPLGWLLKRRPALCTAACALLWLFNVQLYVVSAEALLFFVAGGAAACAGLRPEKLDRAPLWALGAAYAAGIAAQLWALAAGGQAQLWQNTEALPVVLLQKLNILLGLLFFARLAGGIAARKGPAGFFLWLARYSFIIFVAHEYTLTVLKKLALIYLPRTAAVYFLSYLVLPVVVMALCIALGAVLRRLLPRFYGLVTGGRA